MDQIDTAWLAGLLEGEGSFCINKRPHKDGLYKWILISLDMTDRDVVQKAAVLMGAKSIMEPKRDKRSENSKQSYRIVVSGFRAERVMTLILPFMGARRRDKILECLEVYRNRMVPLRNRGQVPDCHPDRKHEGNGLCKQCYRHQAYITKDHPSRLRVRAAVKRDILFV